MVSCDSSNFLLPKSNWSPLIYTPLKFHSRSQSKIKKKKKGRSFAQEILVVWGLLGFSPGDWVVWFVVVGLLLLNFAFFFCLFFGFFLSRHLACQNIHEIPLLWQYRNRMRMQNLHQKACLHAQYIRPQFQAEGLGKLGASNTASQTHFGKFFAHFKKKRMLHIWTSRALTPTQMGQALVSGILCRKTACMVLHLQSKTFGSPTIKTFHLYHQR